jgi:hypothetical protein
VIELGSATTEKADQNETRIATNPIPSVTSVSQIQSQPASVKVDTKPVFSVPMV